MNLAAAPAAQATTPKNKFWKFRNAADGSAELILYGEISDTSWYDDQVTPKDFKADLDALGAVRNITVRINSTGGDVFAATAIGNMLEQHPANVTAHIDGVCASAATFVACHCNKVEAAADATYMIHPVRIGLFGFVSADELEKYKQALDSLKENVLTLYEKKTGQSREDLTAWMDETNWWTASQAKEKGFIDEIIGEENAVTVENRSGFLFVNSVDMKLPFSAAPKFMQDAAAQSTAQSPAEEAPADTPETNPQEGNSDMEIKTLDDARKAYPGLIQQAETEAVNKEQSRLQAIDKVAKLFPAELVDAAKYGPEACDAKELTYRAAMADVENGTAFLKNRAVDAQTSGVKDVASTPPADQKPAAADSPEAMQAQGAADAQKYLDMMKGKVK